MKQDRKHKASMTNESRSTGMSGNPVWISAKSKWCGMLIQILITAANPLLAQTSDLNERANDANDEVQQLKILVQQLQSRVAHLEAQQSANQKKAQEDPAPQAETVPAQGPNAVQTIQRSSVEPKTVDSGSEVSQQVTQPQPPESKPEKPQPFAFADFSWLNGNARTKTPAFDSKFFTPEIRADVDYIYDFNHPKDDTIGGSSEVFRADELQLTQLGVGGDFHYDNVQARFMTQFGMYSQTTPRNDASTARGQWNLDNAYRYVSEAYGGYHINALDGINVQAGIFMSYVGLFSYYNFDDWAYQPS